MKKESRFKVVRDRMNWGYKTMSFIIWVVCMIGAIELGEYMFGDGVLFWCIFIPFFFGFACIFGELERQMVRIQNRELYDHFREMEQITEALVRMSDSSLEIQRDQLMGKYKVTWDNDVIQMRPAHWHGQGDDMKCFSLIGARVREKDRV